ncbi:MAG: Acg family FMN-binding oxidoreductase [Mycobacterium sp.]
MSSAILDADTAYAALALSNRAPSVHNSQPWRWEVGDHSVHLFADDSRHLPLTDPDRRDLEVSCGVALHHCTVAFAALGWRATVRRLPNPAVPDHLASVELRRHAPDDNDIAMASAIPRRRTDRRNFSSWPVSLGDIALMGARAARLGMTVRMVDVDMEFRALLSAAVAEHVADPDYLRELSEWSGRHASVAGVPARNTPVPDPRAAVPGRIFAGAVLAQSCSAPAQHDNGVVLALGTACDGRLDRLRSGEATSAVLLTATVKGLATCPITEVLELPETREQIRISDFAGMQYPQMLIRLGWAPINADPLPATPRRPVDQNARLLFGRLE